MAASHKQRQEHNNLATTQRATLKRARECSESPWMEKPITQMHPLTRVDKVVIEDYYHMATMDENVSRIKQTHLILSSSPWTLGPLLYIYLYFKILNSLLNVHIWEK